MDNSFIDEANRVLVERFKRTKDETTFREIYRRHTPALYRLALRLFAGAEADAQDAVQETWIRAFQLRDLTLDVVSGWKRELDGRDYARSCPGACE